MIIFNTFIREPYTDEKNVKPKSFTCCEAFLLQEPSMVIYGFVRVHNWSRVRHEMWHSTTSILLSSSAGFLHVRPEQCPSIYRWKVEKFCELYFEAVYTLPAQGEDFRNGYHRPLALVDVSGDAVDGNLDDDAGPDRNAEAVNHADSDDDADDGLDADFFRNLPRFVDSSDDEVDPDVPDGADGGAADGDISDASDDSDDNDIPRLMDSSDDEEDSDSTSDTNIVACRR